MQTSSWKATQAMGGQICDKRHPSTSADGKEFGVTEWTSRIAMIETDHHHGRQLRERKRMEAMVGSTLPVKADRPRIPLREGYRMDFPPDVHPEIQTYINVPLRVGSSKRRR
ncbi:hypothetical protein KIN20_011848 [Parelaphostrongylus tenuis]|uniref:Uncharacterized protein n=1 Tax=Parelaphostrongylus tenuis TaxID=148309 RepID=A0AAD5MDK1_PARTN|nr:hypothetical protein KIN20_011848 [Parelaphostrongylus tenuis]